MSSLFLILFPILVSDIINPVLFAGVVFTLGTNNPIRASLSLLFGFFIIYMLSGIVIALGLETILGFLNNPRPIDFIIQLVLSLVLLYNIAYILPFLSLVAIRLIYRESSDAIFARINHGLEKISNVLMPVVIILLALVLGADALKFIITGQSLF